MILLIEVTVRNGRECHNDGLWVTLAKNGNESVTVMGR
jgi:hypothetical protein